VAGIPLPAGADYSLRAEEIKETAFRLDGLLVPGAGSEAHPLVFLEVQFQPDAAFYAPMGAKFGWIYEIADLCGGISSNSFGRWGILNTSAIRFGYFCVTFCASAKALRT
jgi:hypothetical protein